MFATYDLDVWDCIEIADACLAAGTPELIPQMLREGCSPKEITRRLAILTKAEPRNIPKQNVPQMTAQFGNVPDENISKFEAAANVPNRNLASVTADPDAAVEAATLAWFRR